MPCVCRLRACFRRNQRIAAKERREKGKSDKRDATHERDLPAVRDPPRLSAIGELQREAVWRADGADGLRAEEDCVEGVDCAEGEGGESRIVSARGLRKWRGGRTEVLRIDDGTLQE